MEIEALAIARALEFAQSILEGDSKLIIKGLVEKGRSLAPYDLLVQLLYPHAKREDNKVAHSLTRYVITSLECVVWISSWCVSHVLGAVHLWLVVLESVQKGSVHILKSSEVLKR